MENDTTHHEQIAFFIFASYLFLRNEISGEMKSLVFLFPGHRSLSHPEESTAGCWHVGFTILHLPHTQISSDTYAALFFNSYK